MSQSRVDMHKKYGGGLPGGAMGKIAQKLHDQKYGAKEAPAPKFKSSPAKAACAPGDPDCEKGFRIGKQRGKKIKQAIKRTGKKIGKVFRKKRKPLTNEQKRERYDKVQSSGQPVRERPAAKRVDVAAAEKKATKEGRANPYVGGSVKGKEKEMVSTGRVKTTR